MNKNRIRALVLLLICHLPLNGQTVYTIHSDPVLHTVDEKIYGQFLEHIYNSANNGLWGDLIWNRSFERSGGGGGAWSLDGDEVVQLSSGENVRLLFGDTGWRDYEFTLQAKKEGGSEGFLILFRTDGENFYWCNLGGWSNTLHAIEKGTPGVRWSVFGSQIPGSIETGRWADIRVRCEGNHFQVWLDARKLFDFTDNTATAHRTGRVGVGTWVTQARYRNFLVTDIASGDTLFDGTPETGENGISLLNWQKVGTAPMTVSGGALNSSLCVKWVNREPVEVGIEQRGLHLKVQPHRGSFWAKGTLQGKIRVFLMKESQRLAEAEFTGLEADWQEFSFELTPAAETTDGTIRISTTDTGTVWLDQVSMMGRDAVENDGFRSDLFGAVEALHPPCIRWPGGYYSELYRWKDGIGPQHERVVFPVEAWNDRDVNSLGTDEFITLCRRLNAEPIIVINTGHRTSASPQAQWIEEARQWLEYCNGPADSPWGAVRAANGHPEPYGVKYWEMGNELFLTRNAGECANFTKAFVPVLKDQDPSIQIIACGSGGFDQNWNRTILSQCASLIDYISVHHYEDIGNYQSGVTNYENYTKELGGLIAASANPAIGIYMSEWNVWSGLDWRNGLYAGGMLNLFERQGGSMRIAGPALFLRHTSANDWNNALLHFDNSAWFPAPNYVVMKFWRDHYAPHFLAADGSRAGLNVSATRTADGGLIYFKIINTSAGNVPVQVGTDGPFRIHSATLEQIAPGSLGVSNAMENPDLLRVTTGAVETDSGRVRFTVPRFGAVIVTLSQEPDAGMHGDTGDGIRDYCLFPNYPNPFNPETIIRYDLPRAGHVTLRVVDVRGRETAVLFDGEQNAGSHRCAWRGMDEKGLPAGSGVYVCELETETTRIVRKMVLIR